MHWSLAKATERSGKDEEEEEEEEDGEGLSEHVEGGEPKKAMVPLAPSGEHETV